jgi:ABC-type Fe3+/spermidine/putrescine transport system ATPase subunit
VDTSFRDGLQDDIRQIVRDTGLTVIMVSHDPAEVLSMADTLIVLKDGEIVETGHPKKVYNNPEYLYTARLLNNCNVLNANEAGVCGIKAKKECVMIYPEWAEARDSWAGSKWVVQQVLFKGFYEELLLENQGVTLRILNGQSGKFIEGSKVKVKIARYLEY